MSAENAANVVEALDQFGFGSLGLEATDFLVPDQVIQLGYPPARIDLITTPPGVEFENCYESRVEVVIEAVTVNLLIWTTSREARKRRGGCRI